MTRFMNILYQQFILNDKKYNEINQSLFSYIHRSVR